MNQFDETVTLDIRPKQLAELFWNMGTDGQAEFFAELNKIIQHDHATDPKSCGWALGEMQWLYLSKELDKNKPARHMLMAMAAPLYLHTLAYTEQVQP